MLPMAVARSFSARRRRPAEAQCTRSLGFGYKLCAVIPVAGQRAHGTTFRAFKVTSLVAKPGVESAVCDCFVITDTEWSVCKSICLCVSHNRKLHKNAQTDRISRSRLRHELGRCDQASAISIYAYSDSDVISFRIYASWFSPPSCG